MKTILIVDDEPAARYGLRRALESKYRIAEADSAETARGALATEQPDLVLLDVVMPLRNGFQVCRDLKSQEMYAKIPVILVTSKTAPSDRYWGEQQGANGYVAKPFTPDELISAVKRFA